MSKSTARPCDVAWIRSLVGQCKAAGVPCFVKQLGGKPFYCDDDGLPNFGGRIVQRTGDGHGNYYLHFKDRKGGDMSDWPEDLRVREFPTRKDTP